MHWFGSLHCTAWYAALEFLSAKQTGQPNTNLRPIASDPRGSTTPHVTKANTTILNANSHAYLKLLAENHVRRLGDG